LFLKSGLARRLSRGEKGLSEAMVKISGEIDEKVRWGILYLMS